MTLEQDLMAIEQQLWTGGHEAYEANVDQRCLVAFKEVAGMMTNKDIAATAENGRWKVVSLRPKGIANLSETSVVITYECSAKRKDNEPYHALVSSGYVKRLDGGSSPFISKRRSDKAPAPVRVFEAPLRRGRVRGGKKSRPGEEMKCVLTCVGWYWLA